MRLIVKFNIVFLAIFLVGLAIAAYVSLDLLRQNARDEVLQHARIMMESALATRGYTSKQVRPLLETQMKYQFLPQSVPAFLRSSLNCSRNLPITITRKQRSIQPIPATAPPTGKPMS